MDEESGGTLRVFLCILCFVLLAVFQLAVASRRMPPTGDEPHYLVVAHSLAYDQDISLLNNYQEKHYRAFYPGDLPKRTTPSADGKRELPAEGLGLPILLAPAYRLARTFLPPAWLVPFLRLMVCSITIIVLYELLAALAAAGAGTAGMLLCAASFLCAPLLFYSGQFYPEIFAALCVAASLRSLLQMEERPTRALAVLALAPGALVWLHPKYVALAAILLIAAALQFHRVFRVYREFRNWLRIALLLGVGFLGMLSFFFFLNSEYGGWSPNRIYAGWEPQQQPTLWELVRQEGFARVIVMFRMMLGFWIDQRFGILVYAPLYIASIAAIVALLRQRRAQALTVALLFGVHFLALCWGAPLGGFAPPSRHLVVLTPLMLFAACLLWPAWHRRQRILFCALLVLSAAISLMMTIHYRLLFSNLTWRNPDGLSPFWEQMHLSSWIPSLTASNLPLLLTGVWAIFALLIARILIPGENPPAEEQDSFT